MELQIRQIRALSRKNLFLLWTPTSRFGTSWSLFGTPVLVAMFLTVIIRVYFPHAVYGVGTSTSVQSLGDAMAYAGNKTLVLMNNASSTGGEIDRVIQEVSTQVSGFDLLVTTSEDDLNLKCRANFMGVTNCFGAAVFQSSPTEGPGGIWNYTLRADASLGIKDIDVTKNTNDAQINVLPLQHAIDYAISNLSTSYGADQLPGVVDNYLFTSQNEKQRENQIVLDILQTNINVIAVAWLAGFIGVILITVSSLTKERELGMSDLIEAMMPNQQRWEPQMIRLLSHYLSHMVIFLPGSLIMGILMGAVYFKHSSAGLAIVTFILGGLALLSFSIMGGAFFQRANLSAIFVTLTVIILGIIAQIESKHMSNTAIVVTSLLFTPFSLVNMIIFMLQWEHQSLRIQLTKGAPNSNWSLPGIVFWIFFIIQIFAYMALAAVIERWVYGIPSSRHGQTLKHYGDDSPIQVSNFSKVYAPTFWKRVFGNSKPLLAVHNMSLSAPKGQILVLIGANGCGKSTTLNSIAGFSSVTEGHITVSGSVGICPQKNVLWNSISVKDHAKIFNAIKTVEKSDVGKDIDELLEACGLVHKADTNVKSLSGGQKRRLQLFMMLTGGSNISLIDEVTGGLDPLSRHKIWDVLISQRGLRTTIFTTHFLDEAEFLADQLVVMANGQIKAQGTTLELTNRLGGGYRVHSQDPKVALDEMPIMTEPSDVIATIKDFQRRGIEDYEISGPTLEDVFLKVAADPETTHDLAVEDVPQTEKGSGMRINSPEKHDVSNTNSERQLVGIWRQTLILLYKRWAIFRRAPLTWLIALVAPIVSTGLLSLLLNNIQNSSCSVSSQFSVSNLQTLSSTSLNPEILIGPDLPTASALLLLNQSIKGISLGSAGSTSALFSDVHLVGSIGEFNAFTQSNYSTIVPGGIYTGDSSTPPTFIFRSDISTSSIYFALFMQNVLDILLTNMAIATGYATFDFSYPAGTTETLQFSLYFSLLMGIVPALFTVYVTRERVRLVRAVEYSNGVRPFPLWMAYTLFDWSILILAAVVVIIILATAVGDAFYGIGYVFLVLILYSLAGVLLSFLISLIAPSHFSAFALTAAGQFIMLVIYLTAFVSIETRSNPNTINTNIQIVYYVIGTFSPLVQLFHALLVSLNIFSILCVGSPPVKAQPGGFPFFGGPITFLIGQILFMLGLLLWAEHGFSIGRLGKPLQIPGRYATDHSLEKEVADEQERVLTSHDGLKLQHVSKNYRSFQLGTLKALKNVSFGVRIGEVFALVGPNGAGKSTAISLLRGDIKPTVGSLFILDKSLIDDLQAARFHLGVCPQQDALEKLSVREHLDFYARVRGVSSSNIQAVVNSMIVAVGLQPFADAPTADKLSGGNKRRLSLAMALVGDPEVILLDEPTTGIDPMGKRAFWAIARKFQEKRAILLTTHSMEEADALASRVGVLAQRLLDIGTVQELKARHGKHFNIQIVLKSAPESTEEEMKQITEDIMESVRGARLVGHAYHGILRFTVPTDTPPTDTPPADTDESTSKETSIDKVEDKPESKRTIASLFLFLEENKEKLGLEHFSVSPSSFDEVFLNVLSKHDVQEQEMINKGPRWFRFLVGASFFPFSSSV